MAHSKVKSVYQLDQLSGATVPGIACLRLPGLWRCNKKAYTHGKSHKAQRKLHKHIEKTNKPAKKHTNKR